MPVQYKIIFISHQAEIKRWCWLRAAAFGISWMKEAHGAAHGVKHEPSPSPDVSMQVGVPEVPWAVLEPHQGLLSLKCQKKQVLQDRSVFTPPSY